MIELSSNAFQWLGVGVLLTIVGVLIKFRGWTFLLAGYDKSSSIPDDVVANIAGNTVLRIGVAVLVLGAVMAVTDIPSSLLAIFGVIVLVAVVRLIYRLNTYTSAETA